MECVCGICMHWDEIQCDECKCCVELHITSDKNINNNVGKD